MFDNDFTGLIKSGTPSPQQLQQAYQSIFSEYCVLMNNKSYNEVFELTRDINILEAQLQLIDGACNHLSIEQDDIVIGLLKNTGLYIVKPVNIAGLRSQAKTLEITLAQKLAEKELLEKDNPPLTRDHFEDSILRISAEFMYQVNATTITVTQFCKSIIAINKRHEKEEMKNSMRVA